MNITTRIRLTNDQRAKVRGTLAAYLCKMGLPQDVAVAAVTNGSPAMYEQVSRRIARFPSYTDTREVTPEMFNLAFAEWVARKAGCREEQEESVSAPVESSAEQIAV